MKANDLRIGNWVKAHDPIFGVNNYKVATIRDNCIITLNDNISCLVDNIQPIELTEELLVKIGWNKEIDIKTLNEEVFVWHNGIIEYQCGDCNYDAVICQCKYLHQLQNAYYLLTNEELEVKL